jgi:hypothetical protein
VGSFSPPWLKYAVNDPATTIRCPIRAGLVSNPNEARYALVTCTYSIRAVPVSAAESAIAIAVSAVKPDLSTEFVATGCPTT